MSSWVNKETLEREVQNVQLDPNSKHLIATLIIYTHLWILIQDNILASLSVQDGP